jgi:hypothetical protein
MSKIVGLILLAVAGQWSLPYLLYWLLWLSTGRGLPAKTAEQLDHTSKIRRVEKIWALQPVCMTAIAVPIYITTMILCRRYDVTTY